LAPSASGIRAHGPIVALAAATGFDRAGRGAELSIVTILDGAVGDPVTWADESYRLHRSRRGPGPEAFSDVVDDITAHLGAGPVVVYGARQNFALLDGLLPRWRPSTVIDLRPSPLRPALLGSGHDLPAPSRRGTSASRALATALRLVRITSMNASNTAELRKIAPWWHRTADTAAALDRRLTAHG
jgi:hypothetical protein